jgi:hypothetical protein
MQASAGNSTGQRADRHAADDRASCKFTQ